MTETVRVMPHNLDAERSILGAILVHHEAFHSVADVVRPEHFWRDAHRRIFDHMRRLSVKSVPIDFITIKDSLTRSGELETIGGASYLAGLSDGMPRGTHVEHYARIVVEKSQLRELIVAGDEMVSQAYAAGEDAAHVIEDAERVIFEIAQGNAQNGFVSVGSLVPMVMAHIETICQTRNAVTGLATGFTDLDTLTRGFQPGNLILLAARPSQGKTAFAINVAQHASLLNRKVVGVFSLEMSNDELMFRQITGAARVDSHRLQSGCLAESDYRRIALAIGEIGESKLFVDDSPNLGVFEMRARARRLKAEHGLDLLVVDYLQLTASAERKAENRTLEVGQMSRALKVLARELAIPVLVLSQLSRAPELRKDHRPILSDLRDSGALEQDADVVLFLYRDEYYYPGKAESKGLAEIIVSKQRNGPTGTVTLTFIHEFTKFENLARQHEDQRLPAMGGR